MWNYQRLKNISSIFLDQLIKHCYLLYEIHLRVDNLSSLVTIFKLSCSPLITTLVKTVPIFSFLNIKEYNSIEKQLCRDVALTSCSKLKISKDYAGNLLPKSRHCVPKTSLQSLIFRCNSLGFSNVTPERF